MKTKNCCFWKLIFLVALILPLGPGRAHARFDVYQTKIVPIDRVLTNLQQRLAEGSNNVETLYYLARVHSEAYSTNLSVLRSQPNSSFPFFSYPFSDEAIPLEVVLPKDAEGLAISKRHLTNAIYYYNQATKILESGKKTAGLEWISLRINLGLAWCVDQSGAKEEAIKTYRKALVFAWQIEMKSDPISIKDQFNWSWDQIRRRRNPLSRPPNNHYRGPGMVYSAEIIGYLLKLLDSTRDAKEIAQLQKDLKLVNAIPRFMTPILMPLERELEFEDLVNSSANVSFDLDGSGLSRKWGWITPKAGWIVYDHDGSGQITSGLQMFGGVTFWIFWRDGYDALSALDDNGDGKLSGSELRGISVWQDFNGNGLSDPGEVRPITEWGVIEINCGRQVHETGIPFNPKGVVFRDGTTRPTYDWIVPSS